MFVLGKSNIHNEDFTENFYQYFIWTKTKCDTSIEVETDNMTLGNTT